MNDALFGALIGGGFTCLAAYITIRHQGRLSRQQILQSRFAEAYVTLQLYISSWADHAQWSLAIVRLAGETEPHLPQVSDVEGARVSLFASDAVVAVMERFLAAVQRYRLAVGHLEDLRAQQPLPGAANPALQSAVDDQQESARALVAIAEEVHQRLRDDLRGTSSAFWKFVRKYDGLVKMSFLNRAQRLVIVIGLGAALYALGQWLTSLGSNLPYGWVAYAPLSKQFGPDGLHPWARLLIWLALIVIWVATSALLLRSGTTNESRET